MPAPSVFLASVLLAAAFAAASPLPGVAGPASAVMTVYEGQPDMTEKELLRFAADLPEFRAWAGARGGQASPAVTSGKPDFIYSPEAEAWLKAKEWNPRRFFCIMGRTAAGIHLAGASASTAPDMPVLSPAEAELVRRHVGELLKAGAAPSASGSGAERADAVRRAMDKVRSKPSLPARPVIEHSVPAGMPNSAGTGK